MNRLFILCVNLFVTISLYAQPEIRNLSLYDMKGDVYYFIERQYKARMAFGELEKGDLLETCYYRFDKSGNLVFFETEGKDKEGKSKKENQQFSYNAQKQLTQILNSDNSKIVFTYSNGRLTQFDRYDKDGELLDRTKRKYSSSSNFTDIEYNSNGKEKKQYTYRNGLLVSEKTSISNRTYTYNTQRKQTLVKYSGRELDMGEFMGAMMWANVSGDVDAISGIKGKAVSSTIRNTYNTKGLLTKAVTTKGSGQTEIVNFKYEYDAKGNWVKNVATYNGPKIDEFIIIFEREIVYYSNKNQQSTYTSLTDVRNAEDKAKYTTNLPDREATFPGGIAAISKYISENLQYPSIAQENGIAGQVKVSFVVDRDGSVTDVKVVKSVDVDHFLDKEAIRVISNMPKWNPGIKDGEFVRYQYTIPINFGVK